MKNRLSNLFMVLLLITAVGCGSAKKYVYLYDTRTGLPF